jgi:hypothetical protein
MGGFKRRYARPTYSRIRKKHSAPADLSAASCYPFGVRQVAPECMKRSAQDVTRCQLGACAMCNVERAGVARTRQRKEDQNGVWMR